MVKQRNPKNTGRRNHWRSLQSLPSGEISTWTVFENAISRISPGVKKKSKYREGGWNERKPRFSQVLRGAQRRRAFKYSLAGTPYLHLVLRWPAFDGVVAGLISQKRSWFFIFTWACLSIYLDGLSFILGSHSWESVPFVKNRNNSYRKTQNKYVHKKWENVLLVRNCLESLLCNLSFCFVFFLFT